jgi:hypothetical protein
LNNNNRNNNNNNNRRRGRGNNRPQGGGRGEQLNRIDSRARGNAPQLLEKYRKLAQDAHLNGDRVTAEYYLQFADHYFRVIADQRLRQEEQRARRDDRFGDGAQDGGQDEGDEGEFGNEGDFGFDQPVFRREEPREPRDSREFREPRESREPREFRSENRPAPRERANGVESRPVHSGAEEAVSAAVSDDRRPAGRAAEGEVAGGNPFTPESRGTRGLRPRRESSQPRNEPPSGEAGGNGLDPATLPPAIAEAREDIAEAAPEAPRRRTRRPRATPRDEGQGSLEVVGG